MSRKLPLFLIALGLFSYSAPAEARKECKNDCYMGMQKCDATCVNLFQNNDNQEKCKEACYNGNMSCQNYTPSN